jgi:hypothetical protein
LAVGTRNFLNDWPAGCEPSINAREKMTNDENRMTNKCLNDLMTKAISDLFGILGLVHPSFYAAPPGLVRIESAVGYRHGAPLEFEAWARSLSIPAAAAQFRSNNNTCAWPLPGSARFVSSLAGAHAGTAPADILIFEGNC